MNPSQEKPSHESAEVIHDSESAKCDATPNPWRRRFIAIMVLWGLSLFAMSFPAVRGLVAYPLYVSNDNASGEAAYVMADGFAYWERLHAASDLYNMNRVKRIIILDEQDLSMYNFVKQRSDLLVERAVDYLVWKGVPRDKISTVPVTLGAPFGSLSEAQTVAREEPDLQSIVVVTSAMHTRRSLLCFRRSMPDDVRVDIYVPTVPSESWEVGSPIWTEYVKLIVYYFVA